MSKKFSNPELEKEIVDYITGGVYQLTRKKLSEKFGISIHNINTVLKKYELEHYIFTGKTDEQRKNISNTLKAKYASGELISPWSNSEIVQVGVQTKKEKYKSEDYKLIHDKAVITAMNSLGLSSKEEYYNYLVTKTKETKLERYGDENYNNSKQMSEKLRNKSEEEKRAIREKTRNTNLERYGGVGNESDILKNKYEVTMMEKYGVKHNWSSKDPKLNGVDTRNKLFGDFYAYSLPRGRQTRAEKYGDPNYNNREKAAETCLEKYGVSSPCMTPQAREALLQPQVIEKRFNTMKENGTVRTSKAENDFYETLLQTYSEEDIKTNYNSDPRYPFHCDFYIVPEDKFIELNLHPTHGLHPFDINNSEDLKLLEDIKKKAKTSKYYENIIDVWTKRDVLKLNTAIKNKLNYTMIYPGDMIYDY